MFPVSHLDKQEKQAQRYSLFLRKYSFHINQISSRDYICIDIDVSKYYKINLGKLYSGHGCWRHPGQIAKNCKIGNIESTSI